MENAEVELGSIRAGPRGIVLGGLRITGPDYAVDVEHADLRLAFWASLARRKIDIEHATLEDVVLTVDRTKSPAPGSGTDARARRSFSGLGPIAQLPRWLRLRELSAAGAVAVTAAPGAHASGPWELTARGLEADSAATARLVGRLDFRRGAMLASAPFDMNASADIAEDSRVRRLALNLDAHPVGDPRGLRAVATIDLDGASERYVLDLRGRRGLKIAHLEGALDSGRRLTGQWQADLAPDVVAAFIRTKPAPTFSARSTGRVQADLASRRAQIQTSTEIEALGETLDPRLQDLGHVRLKTILDGQIEPGRIELKTLRMDLGSAERTDFVQLVSLQPLRFESGSGRFDPETWGEPALRVRANDVPLRWLRHFSPDENLEGGRFSGAVDVVREGPTRTALRVTEPLKASGIELRAVRVQHIPVFDVTIVPRATLENGSLQAEIEELKIAAVNGLEVDFHGYGETSREEWPIARFDGSIAARIPALQRLLPQLAEVHAATRFGIDLRSMTLTISAAELEAKAADGRELLAADLSGQRPLRVTVPELAADWDDFEPRKFSLRLDGMPISWLSQFIPELEFRSGSVSGELTAAARLGRGLRIESEGPLVIANVLPAYRGLVAKRTVTLTVRPRLLLATAESSLSFEDLRMQTEGGDELRGEVRVDAPAGRDYITTSIALDGDFPSLAREYGARLGKLRWRQRADFEPGRHRFTVRELEIDLGDTAGVDFLSVRGVRPFYVFSQRFGVGVDDGSTEILHATVAPVRLQDVLPRILGFDLEGDLPQGEFSGRVGTDRRLVLASDEPLFFRDVTVRWGEATLLDRVTTKLDYEVAYSADALEARSVDLTVLGPDGDVLVHTSTEATAPLRNDRLLDSARIAVEANLGPLAREPVLADLVPFESGVFQASLEIVNDGDTMLTLGARLRDADTRTLGRLPDVDLALDAAGIRGDHMTLTIPLRLQSPDGGPSDLRFDGSLSRDADGMRHLEAALTGDRVAMADLERLVDFFQPQLRRGPVAESVAEERRGIAPLSPEQLSAIAKLRSERQSTPAWTNGVLGSATVSLGSVVFPSFAVDGVRGELELSPEQARLSGIEASLLGASIAADATVDFDDARPKPYSLDFRADMSDLDVGKLFRAIDPNQTPTTEGLFDMQTAFTGTGLNPLDLGLSMLGDIRLDGRDGVFRGLAEKAGTGSTAARVIGLLTFSRELKAVGRLLDGLGEIEFDRAEFVLSRSTPHRIDVKRLFVQSPQLEIDATGSLELAPRRPVLLSPMEVSVLLAARGDVATLFDGMQLLGGEAGETGYREVTKPIEIGGTPVEPDASAFWELLEEGANNARGSFGRTLRVLNRRLEKRREGD